MEILGYHDKASKIPVKFLTANQRLECHPTVERSKWYNKPNLCQTRLNYVNLCIIQNPSKLFPSIFIIVLLLTTAAKTVAGQDEDADTELINEFLSGGAEPEVVSPEKLKIPDRSKNVAPLSISGQGKLPQGEGDTSKSSEETFTEPRSCKCVKYYLCNIDNGTVVDNGDVLGLIDIRLGASKPSACPHYFDICCPVSVSLSNTIPSRRIKGYHNSWVL